MNKQLKHAQENWIALPKYFVLPFCVVSVQLLWLNAGLIY